MPKPTAIECRRCGHYASEHNAPPSTACRVRFGSWSDIAPGQSTLNDGELCGCKKIRSKPGEPMTRTILALAALTAICATGCHHEARQETPPSQVWEFHRHPKMETPSSVVVGPTMSIGNREARY